MRKSGEVNRFFIVMKSKLVIELEIDIKLLFFFVLVYITRKSFLFLNAFNDTVFGINN